MRKNLSRRTFIKGTVGAGLVLASSGTLVGCKKYDSKGLPTIFLGSTGVKIPLIAMGLGSRFCSVSDEEEALRILTYALDNGLYYWDTAHIYKNTENGAVSEERIGKVLKYRRDEIFISTKVTNRDPNEAMRQIEKSLKRLQTEKLDMLKIHSIESMEDVELISRKGGLIDIVQRMKAEGVTRFVGFSGHNHAAAMKAMADRGDFDSMLIAMNHYNGTTNPQLRQEMAIPAALEKRMGVMLMKAVRPKENIPSIQVPGLIRFALSLNGANGLIVGMDSLDVVESNLQILRSFTPMSSEEKTKMAGLLSPYFNHQNLDWMEENYSDGHWKNQWTGLRMIREA
ncbi:MAG: aldo/keto reductase [Prolixibacteraceae bacterium]|jgi:predicted aldo/keto reductase-like oxidoreductase|nr:aldo/keto reductase [Prolixibacteraceae bacterium]